MSLIAGSIRRAVRKEANMNALGSASQVALVALLVPRWYTPLSQYASLNVSRRSTARPIVRMLRATRSLGSDTSAAGPASIPPST